MSQQHTFSTQAQSGDLRKVAHKEGHRLTLQRQLVLDSLRECDGHCTPDQVYERVLVKSPAISRATIYRTLAFLVELGFVTVAQIKDNVTIYELATAMPHHHLVCQRCDQLYEVRHEVVQPLFARIEREFGFTVRTDHLMLFGVCEKCAGEQMSR